MTTGIKYLLAWVFVRELWNHSEGTSGRPFWLHQALLNSLDVVGKRQSAHFVVFPSASGKYNFVKHVYLITHNQKVVCQCCVLCLNFTFDPYSSPAEIVLAEIVLAVATFAS